MEEERKERERDIGWELLTSEKYEVYNHRQDEGGHEADHDADFMAGAGTGMIGACGGLVFCWHIGRKTSMKDGRRSIVKFVFTSRWTEEVDEVVRSKSG